MTVWSWDAASEFVASKGFTEHFCGGTCGGAGFGSRHYFVKPGCALRDGKPSEFATLSYTAERWCVSIHEPGRNPTSFRPSIVGGTDYGD